MDAVTLERVLALCDGALAGEPRKDAAQAAPGQVQISRVTTDSRDVGPGDLFVCLEGPRFDGHEFARAAVDAGAAAVLAHKAVPVRAPVVLVDDTLTGLGCLGRANREAMTSALVIAITGSNGKTSTKDLVAGALGRDRRVVRSARSFNNAIGVPLTLLAGDATTEALVAEVGTNAPGEIASLGALVRPHVAVIANCRASHLSGLGSVEGVREEKGSLLEALCPPAAAVLNRDDPSFDQLAERAPRSVVSFGMDAAADLRATDVRCDEAGTSFRCDGLEVRVAHLGRHAVSNALAALAVADVAGVEREVAVAGLLDVRSPPGRLQVRQLGALTVLDDTYNANPGSLAAATRVLAELTVPGRRVAVVGDMLELGDAGRELHRQAGERLAQAGVDVLVAVGCHAPDLLEGARAGGLAEDASHACDDVAQAASLMARVLRRDDTVLVKASRAVHLEGLVSELVHVSARVA